MVKSLGAARAAARAAARSAASLRAALSATAAAMGSSTACCAARRGADPRRCIGLEHLRGETSPTRSRLIKAAHQRARQVPNVAALRPVAFGLLRGLLRLGKFHWKLYKLINQHRCETGVGIPSKPGVKKREGEKSKAAHAALARSGALQSQT